MFGQLNDAVGPGMPNRKEDVQAVQNRLQAWDKTFHPGPSPGSARSILDVRTAMAIERFQREKMGMRLPTGMIKPEDATAKKLAGTPGPQPEGRVLWLPIRTDFQPLTVEDYQTAATALDCEARTIRALAQVESYESGFDFQGRPQILFERRLFNRHTFYLFEKTNPELTIELPKAYGPLPLQWSRLEAAYKLRSRAALLSTSWGKFQILGENYRECKYPLLEVFISEMCISEKNHLKAFVQFVKSNHRRLDGLRSKNWVELAKSYNGKGYKAFNYDERLSEAYDKLGK